MREETDENRHLGVVIFDEVKLREEIQLNATSLKVDGFIDFGVNTPMDMKTSVANHVLVFMFVLLLFHWVQPVTVYASRNATPGDILAKIMIQVILQLEQQSVRIIGSDGSQSNKKVW